VLAGAQINDAACRQLLTGGADASFGLWRDVSLRPGFRIDRVPVVPGASGDSPPNHRLSDLQLRMHMASPGYRDISGIARCPYWVVLALALGRMQFAVSG